MAKLLKSILTRKIFLNRLQITRKCCIFAFDKFYQMLNNLIKTITY